MRKALFRLALMVGSLVVVSSRAEAQEGAWCHYSAPHCCDHTGWCFTGCPEGPSGPVLKYVAAQVCSGSDT